MSQASPKDNVINIRTQFSQKELIDRAAESLNKSRSDFILEVVCREAENVLLDKQLFFVDDKAYAKFLSLLDSPVDKNYGLKELLGNKAPWEE